MAIFHSRFSTFSLTLMRTILAVVIVAFVVACGSESASEGTTVDVVSADSISQFDQSTITHAEGFDIRYDDQYKYVTVYDPWADNTPMYQYRLYQKGNKPTATDDWIDVQVPVERAVCLSTTHLGFMDVLGVLDRVIGVDEADFVYSSELRKRIADGEVQEFGGIDQMKMERLVDEWPDLIMVSPMEGSRSRIDQLNQVGLVFAFNIEWQEKSPLARAEWIKFVAAFFNQEDVANQHFSAVATEYDSIRALATAVEERPATLVGAAFKGTWYMPAGESFVTSLMQDAGGSYYFSDRPGTGSLSLSFEEVVDACLEAPIWLNPGSSETLEELAGKDDRYRLFKAFQNGGTYNNNARVNEFGNNDYWESGVAWPNRVLKDLVKVLHPELLPDYQLYYYQQLQ